MEKKYDLNQLSQVACNIIDEINLNKVSVIGLSGQLGAGKTTLVQNLAQQLGVKETVTSPSFVVGQFYNIPSEAPWQRLAHFDFYRLDSKANLEVIGWPEAVADTRVLTIAEWPENITPTDWPNRSLRFVIKVLDNNMRVISKIQ